MGLFTKAVKHDAKLRLAIAGPSGSGKTFSALAIATGLGGPIAFVDTEHGSASKYADIFDFDVAEMHAPYHPDKFIKAIQGAAEAGYKVVILDSMTHAWNGEGGLLELVEQATKRQKTPNSYTAWHDVTPIQNKLIEAIVSTNIHIIATMRSKQEYVQEKDNNGRSTIRKVGMAPIQRDGFEYEFDIFFDMDTDNNAVVSKTRCSALAGQVIAKPGAQVAKTLKNWLSSDAPKPAKNATGENTPQGADGDVDGDTLFATETPPHQRMWGQGMGVFGPDWDMARPWLISKWTAKVTPDNTRNSASELSDTEKDQLADYIKESAAALQRIWIKQKAAMLQSTGNAVTIVAA